MLIKWIGPHACRAPQPPGAPGQGFHPHRPRPGFSHPDPDTPTPSPVTPGTPRAAPGTPRADCIPVPRGLPFASDRPPVRPAPAPQPLTAIVAAEACSRLPGTRSQQGSCASRGCFPSLCLRPRPAIGSAQLRDGQRAGRSPRPRPPPPCLLWALALTDSKRELGRRGGLPVLRTCSSPPQSFMSFQGEERVKK